MSGGSRIRDPKLGLSFQLHFDKELFGCVWYWKGIDCIDGYPWYGTTFNIGLGFWTGYPGCGAAKANGSIRTIEGGQTIETDFTANIEHKK